MALNAFRGKTSRTAPVAPAPLAIGEVEGEIFGCPVCSRPLAPGAGRCPGCGTRLVLGVPAGKASLLVAVGLTAGLAVGVTFGAVAAAGVPAAGAAPPPVAVATQPPSPSPAATPGGSAATGVPAMARTAIAQAAELHVRLATHESSLDAYLRSTRLDVPAVARVLRSVVSDAGYGTALGPRMAQWPRAQALATESAAFYEGLREAARTGLRHSLADDDAYRAAAASVVELLAQLPSVDQRTRALAAEAGVDVAALPAPAPEPAEAAAAP